MFQKLPQLAALTLSLALPADACLWDSETLALEKARFPGVEEIITGDFIRHSREFYAWRKSRSEKLLATDPSLLAAYDDLAVSQHKLGDHQAAIGTMLRKEKIKPGIYETYSNLGTFHIYTGDLPRSLEFLNKALAINPNAHFGREKYQKWLVEWILAGKPGEDARLDDNPLAFKPEGYAHFIVYRETADRTAEMTGKSRREALRGVLGMMLFADFNNPLLLEALGDVLLIGDAEDNATHLASLAYLHAAKKSGGTEDEVALLMRKFESASMRHTKGMDAPKLQAQLDAGLAKGIKFNEQIRADEVAWIAAGKDASAEFLKKYLKP